MKLLKNTIQNLVMLSSFNFKKSDSCRKQDLIDSVMNEYKTRKDTPRTSKYRSFKGVFS